MEYIFNSFLVIHIISGFVAFIAAPVALLVKKGSGRHRQFGKLFFWAMTAIAGSAFVMSVLHANPFLFMIAGFSYYLCASGYRWIYRKNVVNVNNVAVIDWVLVIAAGLFNISLLLFGFYSVYYSTHNPYGYVSVIFGLLGLNFVRGNIRQFFKPSDKKYAWLLNHMGGMAGAYITTLSAFSAVNFTFLPTIIQWLWPGIIGTPLLYAWIGYYKRKIKKGIPTDELFKIINK